MTEAARAVPPPAGAPAYFADVTAAIDTAAEELVAISRDIHAHPETNYEERHAAALLTETLEHAGFAVERGVGGVETAFRATLDGARPGPTVALLLEYDALPEIGHGCGHNLIAISNLGAGFGVQAAIDRLPGRIALIGTPAEEGGGGKIRLLDAGVFDGVDVALSSHPAGNLTVLRDDAPEDEQGMLAMVGYRYAFHGKASHAAARPDAGVNALNAVIRLFTGIDGLRQHLRDDVRIHGIITDGGTAANVVPEFAAANFMLRSRDGAYLRETVEPRVRAIAEGAALMTGARLEVSDFYPFYDNVRPNNALGRAARRQAEALGVALDDPSTRAGGGGASTDFGNVSQRVPSLAMSFAVSERPVAGHSQEMTAAAITDLAHRSALNVAKTLALTACELLDRPALLDEVRAEFARRGADAR
jgi:amidohydrolase